MFIHLISLKIDASDSRVDRASSVSSTRMMNFPPVFLANNQLNNAVRAPPTCSDPVGEGAKRTLTGLILAALAIITTFPRLERLVKALAAVGERNATHVHVNNIATKAG